MKRFKRIALAVIVLSVLAAVGYAAYFLGAYHRIGDHEIAVGGAGEPVQTDTPYTAITYNIGFAAYTPEFDFFMDGGRKGRAASEESVERVMAQIGDFLGVRDADFLLVQEVDADATRSYHVDERARLCWALEGYETVFAENFDSPYIILPLREPHGKSLAGMLTASRYAVTDAKRVELPVEQSLYKVLDLDRCYSVCRIPVENGRELVLFNVHLSAYTSDGTVATEQLKLLLGELREEYEAGNYVICGGDFNKDMLGDSSEHFGIDGGEYNWAQPFPQELLQGSGIRLAAYDLDAPIPSCRNADEPYHEEQFVLTVDGFLVSDNVRTEPVCVIDTGFSWSDHNPAELRFTLLG